jgi:DNA repair exonuclease SbcCD ATPase subunit
MNSRGRRLSQRERQRRAAEKERKVQKRQKVQEDDQLIVLAEVTIYFRPEVHKTFGREKTFKQVAMVNQGSFMKAVAAPGSNIEGQELYNMDVIAGMQLIPSTIQVAEVVPPEPLEN